jgi:hypothetical protein
LEHEIDDAIAEAGKMDKEALKKFKEDNQIPKHVQSIKSLSDFNRNSSFNLAEPYSNLPESMRDSLPQDVQLGEDATTIKRLTVDGLLEEIRKWKSKASSCDNVSTTDKIIKALNKAEDEISNEAPQRGELQHKQTTTEPKDSRRTKKVKRRSIEAEGFKEKLRKGYTWTENKRVRDLPVSSGDDVRIKTARFGKEYAKDKPEFTYGKVIDLMMNDQAKVKWQQGDIDMVTRLSLKIKTISEISVPVLCGKERSGEVNDKTLDFDLSKRRCNSDEKSICFDLSKRDLLSFLGNGQYQRYYLSWR